MLTWSSVFASRVPNTRPSLGFLVSRQTSIYLVHRFDNEVGVVALAFNEMEPLVNDACAAARPLNLSGIRVATTGLSSHVVPCGNSSVPPARTGRVWYKLEDLSVSSGFAWLSFY
jgi:hypothetical protein